MNNNPNMTVADGRAAGFCVKGQRRRCRELGLDFRTLVKEGFPVSQMEQIDDANIQRTLAVTRARLSKES